jgi:hypothetical protein
MPIHSLFAFGNPLVGTHKVHPRPIAATRAHTRILPPVKMIHMARARHLKHCKQARGAISQLLRGI